MADELRKAVVTRDAPTPHFAYSQAIVSAGLVFIAGQIPLDPDGQMPESFEEQAHQVMRNLAAVAEAAGGSLGDAVRVNVYLADIGRAEEMNEIYKGYFTEPLPARTTIAAGLRGFQVEADAIVALRVP
jgi:2-iminobutanoate/2-iminopropanoate deaminase